MKKSMIAAVAGIVFVGLMAQCFAESEAINPAKVSTPQIVVYGTSSASTFAGDVTISGTLSPNNTSLPNLIVLTNALISGTTLTTGVVTFTAIPRLNAAPAANGVLTNGPSSLPSATSNTNGIYFLVNVGGTNVAVKGFPQ